MSRSKVPPIERDAAWARKKVLVARGILALAIFCVNANQPGSAGAITLRDWCGCSYNLMLVMQSPLAAGIPRQFRHLELL
jgi:hypothetical protein